MNDLRGAPRRRSASRLPAIAFSLAAHGAVLWAILLWKPPPTVETGLEPVTAVLVEAASLEPAPSPAPAAAPAPSRPAPPRPSRARRAQRAPPPDVQALPADPVPLVTEAQLAGAATADSGGGDGTGSGSGGGACNMARRLQTALRQDRLVQVAVAGAHASGRPILVWRGDWLRSAGEDGKGLAAVREAIVWGVAFAPAGCRAQPVHGLVLLTLGDGARLVLGGGDWRWQDLLALHRDG